MLGAWSREHRSLCVCMGGTGGVCVYRRVSLCVCRWYLCHTPVHTQRHTHLFTQRHTYTHRDTHTCSHRHTPGPRGPLSLRQDHLGPRLLLGGSGGEGPAGEPPRSSFMLSSREHFSPWPHRQPLEFPSLPCSTHHHSTQA